jgi:hypothetical protein
LLGVKVGLVQQHAKRLVGGDFARR